MVTYESSSLEQPALVMNTFQLHSNKSRTYNSCWYSWQYFSVLRCAYVYPSYHKEIERLYINRRCSLQFLSLSKKTSLETGSLGFGFSRLDCTFSLCSWEKHDSSIEEMHHITLYSLVSFDRAELVLTSATFQYGTSVYVSFCNVHKKKFRCWGGGGLTFHKQRR